MIIEKLESVLKNIFESCGFKIDKVTIVNSNRPDLCDFQCNDLFKLSKIFKKSPIEIGQDIENYEGEEKSKVFKKLEFVKPGFLNMTLSDEFINENIRFINESKSLGIKLPKKETFVIDYGGPNVAKPLHVGHMRSAIVGESIKRIIKYMGHDVIADIHLGDYGLQIGQVIYGLEKNNIKNEDIKIELLNKLYPEISALCKENEEVSKICADITKKLQDGDEKYQKVWQKIMEVSIQDMKSLYSYLDVNFDLWYGESDSYLYLDELKSKLDSQNLLYESEGALVVDIKKDTDKKEIPPLLFQKTNGAYLYASTDLATILQRVKDYKPNHILYVVDNRQSLHFEQVFRVSDKIKLKEYQNLEFLGFGTVNGKDNKPYKTREGKAPSLADLFKQTEDIFISKKEENKNMNKEDIKKIVNAILKFADLQNSREKDYIFDLDKFSDVTGKTGPYILYTYLRMNKIINEVEIKNETLNNKIYDNFDRDLRLKILDASNTLNSAFVERKPSYLANYLYNLCVSANAFYAQNHILGCTDTEKQENWLYVIKLLNKVIKDLLYLLGIEIPSKM